MRSLSNQLTRRQFSRLLGGAGLALSVPRVFAAGIAKGPIQFQNAAPACGLDTLGQTPAQAARTQKAKVPADQMATAAAWQTWLGKQHTTGKGAIADYANPEQMNRYTWYQAHGWKLPYPGDSAIFAPAQVPGAYIPSADTN